MTITKEEREEWLLESKETIELNADWEIRVKRLLDALENAEEMNRRCIQTAKEKSDAAESMRQAVAKAKASAAEMERQRDRLIYHYAGVNEDACIFCPVTEEACNLNETCNRQLLAWAAQKYGDAC